MIVWAGHLLGKSKQVENEVKTCSVTVYYRNKNDKSKEDSDDDSDEEIYFIDHPQKIYSDLPKNKFITFDKNYKVIAPKRIERQICTILCNLRKSIYYEKVNDDTIDSSNDMLKRLFYPEEEICDDYHLAWLLYPDDFLQETMQELEISFDNNDVVYSGSEDSDDEELKVRNWNAYYSYTAKCGD